jgi:RNA polymerase sigma-70 factor (ECF subfamily)
MRRSTSFVDVAPLIAPTRPSRANSKHPRHLPREMETEICTCVSRLTSTLKPEYAEALQVIEVGGKPVRAFAEEKRLSPSNAAVRVFRAREALKERVMESCGICAEHGCVDCTCRQV